VQLNAIRSRHTGFSQFLNQNFLIDHARVINGGALNHRFEIREIPGDSEIINLVEASLKSARADVFRQDAAHGFSEYGLFGNRLRL
jgi:hypothetical protein